MGPGIFQFQSMMTTVVSGISGSMLSSIQTVAYMLMTICLALGIYEAYVRGGDLRSLATTFLKYAVAAFAIGYWSNVFSDTFSGFNTIASGIDSSFGGFDLISTWSNGLANLFKNNGYDAMMKSIPWTPAALLTLLELALAYIHLSPLHADLCGHLHLLGIVPLCRRSVRHRARAQLARQLALQVLHAQPDCLECVDGALCGLWLPDFRDPHE